MSVRKQEAGSRQSAERERKIGFSSSECWLRPWLAGCPSDQGPGTHSQKGNFYLFRPWAFALPAAEDDSDRVTDRQKLAVDLDSTE